MNTAYKKMRESVTLATEVRGMAVVAREMITDRVASAREVKALRGRIECSRRQARLLPNNVICAWLDNLELLVLEVPTY